MSTIPILEVAASVGVVIADNVNVCILNIKITKFCKVWNKPLIKMITYHTLIIIKEFGESNIKEILNDIR